MIDPNAVITYAQYNEDMILAALFYDIEKGFYIDIGANYHVIDSVTFYFYMKGWRGINIEPVTSLYKQLKTERPEDMNLCIGIGAKKGTAVLREYPKLHGHSTFSETEKEGHKQEEYVDRKVQIETLNDIFHKYVKGPVHFVKIDVEGFESEVVAGNDWAKNRPEVVCIEANHDKDLGWRKALTSNKYKLFISDSLNEYYIAEEAWSRTSGFQERVIKLDYHALKQHQYQSWSEDSKTLTKLHELVARQHEEILRLQQNVTKLSKNALTGVSYPERLKRSAKGLTTEWAKEHKKRKSK